MKLRALFVIAMVGCAGRATHGPTMTVAPAPPPSVAAPSPPIESAPALPIEAAPVPPAPPLQVAWAKVADGGPNYIDAVAVRPDGAILVAGSDDGHGWLAKPRRRKPTGAGAVVSISATGETQWVREIGSAEIHAIAALPDGGAIACGDFTGTLKVDGKPRAKAKGSRNIVVLALDPAGKVTWVFGAGGAQFSACNDVAVTPEGYIVLVGVIMGDGQFGELSTHTLGDRDAFVAELDAGGAPRWVTTGGGSEGDEARAVAIAGSAIYVAGQFGGAASFGDHHLALPAGAARQLANPSNVYVARYSTSGDIAWATSYGIADSFDQAWGITGLSDGGAAVVGEVGGHAFVARYTSGGRQRWARAAGNDSVARAVVALPNDDLIVAAYWGWPQGGHELALVGTTRTVNLTAQGSDTALARYSASGELLAAARIAGATPHHRDDRDGSEAEIFDIARTGTGRLVLAGRLWGSARFDAGRLLRPTDLRLTVPDEHGSLLVALDPAP